jgi:hypothetical protein
MASIPRIRPLRDFDGFEGFPELKNGMGITTQVVNVTKEIALEWMSRPGYKQRELLSEHLDALKRELIEGRWILNGSPIIFDREDRILTGRHRLTAVIQTGITMLVLVVRGVDPDAYDSINGGAKGRACSSLNAAGVSNSSHIAAAAKMLKRYEMGCLKGMDTPRSVELLGTAALEIQAEHPGLQDSFCKVSQAFRLCGYRGSLTFCHYILAGLHPELADDFFRKFGSGEDMHKGHPVLALRNYVIQCKDKGGGKIMADDLPILIFKAWNYCRLKKSMVHFKVEPDERLQQPI